MVNESVNNKIYCHMLGDYGCNCTPLRNDIEPDMKIDFGPDAESITEISLLSTRTIFSKTFVYWSIILLGCRRTSPRQNETISLMHKYFILSQIHFHFKPSLQCPQNSAIQT